MRCILLCLLPILSLTACWNDCHPQASKSLTLGTGEEDFNALDAEAPEYGLFPGPHCRAGIGS